MTKLHTHFICLFLLFQMARAGLVHHDRSRLKRELQEAQDEWKHLNRHVRVLNKVTKFVRNISICFYLDPVS